MAKPAKWRSINVYGSRAITNNNARERGWELNFQNNALLTLSQKLCGSTVMKY